MPFDWIHDGPYRKRRRQGRAIEIAHSQGSTFAVLVTSLHGLPDRGQGTRRHDVARPVQQQGDGPMIVAISSR